MDSILSPVGHWGLRNDSMGLGDFLTPRGTRLHDGVDLTCNPGQDIYSPIRGIYHRLMYPYTNAPLTGMCICATWVMIHILYIEPLINEGEQVAQGQIIAHAQNIQDRYGELMVPHIHLRVSINPNILDKEVLRSWVDDPMRNT